MPFEDGYDVIVIGGGIAGSVASFHLATRGYRVLLIEKEKRPHPKVCGEFLSPETGPFLEEMDIEPQELGAVPITGLRLYSRWFELETPIPEGAIGLSRERLDEALIKKAEEAGAGVVRGLTVVGIESNHDGIGYRLKTTGPVIQAQTLFLATGKYDNPKLSKRFGREGSAIGFKAHIRLSPSARKKLGSHVELYFYRGGYAGLSPIEEEETNFCFIIDRQIYNRVGNRFWAALDYLQRENRELKRMLNEIPLENWKVVSTANIPHGYLYQPPGIRDETDGCYHLGDQMAVIPSFTGTGMTIAFLTGKLAAEQFDDAGREKGEGGASRYHEDLYRLLYPAMEHACPLHNLCRSPWFADGLVFFLRLFPKAIDRMITQGPGLRLHNCLLRQP